jgi:fibro-slime domain-containing protein
VDTPAYNQTIVSSLTIPRLADGSYRFETAEFSPIDGMGFGNTPGFAHNYGFTSEVRYWFQYAGSATLSFTGDDDVWVFVNKKLAVDLGGLHAAITGSIALNAADGTGVACDLMANCRPPNTGHVVDFGLLVGSVYEIVVFQAERHTSASNYLLTLSNFNGTKSSCASACGDGIVTAHEACDLGAANNTGAYGGCNPDCTLAPYRGDRLVQSDHGEQCDSTPDCAPNCKRAVVR